jgi:hypothetical protein
MWVVLKSLFMLSSGKVWSVLGANTCSLAFPRYEGLSEVFLSCPVPKLLLLAGTDRLDRYCYPEPYEEFLKVK